jgi:hypothetical protein
VARTTATIPHMPIPANAPMTKRSRSTRMENGIGSGSYGEYGLDADHAPAGIALMTGEACWPT